MEPTATTIEDGGGGRLAVVACAGDAFRPDRDELADVVRGLPPEAPLVAVTVGDGGRDALIRMAGLQRPGAVVVQGVPVTDALKLVSGGRIQGTVDRTGLVTLRLPALVERPLLSAVVDGAPRGPLDLVAALVDAAGSVIIVDAAGRVYGGAPPRDEVSRGYPA